MTVQILPVFEDSCTLPMYYRSDDTYTKVSKCITVKRIFIFTLHVFVYVLTLRSSNTGAWPDWIVTIELIDLSNTEQH